MDDLPTASEPVYDAVVIGSGPSGVATVQAIRELCPTWRTIVLERGNVGLRTHAWNMGPSLRRPTYYARSECPWLSDGALYKDKIFLPNLGGRGSHWGCVVPRFQSEEFADWPFALKDLESDYAEAERWLSAGDAGIVGALQDWVSLQLAAAGYAPSPAPLALDTTPTGNWTVARGFDSAAARLETMAIVDTLRSSRMLAVVTGAFATRLLHDGSSADGVRCLDLSRPEAPPVTIRGNRFFLAASPIESARLAINSGLPDPDHAMGRFLADHLLCQVAIELPAPQPIRRAKWPARFPACAILVRTSDHSAEETSLVEIHDGWIDSLDAPSDGSIRLWLRAYGSVDPQPRNRVTTDQSSLDQFGVPRATVSFMLGPSDRRRVARLAAIVRDIAAAFGVTLPEGAVRLIPPGSVNHECGTLRMTSSNLPGMTTSAGRIAGMSNVYVCDASSFPSSGVTNPCLTISALARRVVRLIAANAS